jgi:hypothetical protein
MNFTNTLLLFHPGSLKFLQVDLFVLKGYLGDLVKN